jgi:REP element-mobilizing transposase RayT
MARPLRIEFPGAVYHLTARGDRQEPIFEDERDRAALLDVVACACERFDAGCFAYCLMGNHYHFVVQTRQANLSRCMRHVNAVYSQRYNRRHKKAGHVFQGRFHAVLVDTDAYLLAACRYVDLNPVRAGLVARPRDWRWSSYRAHVGLVDPPPWLLTQELHRQIAPRAASTRECARAYASFVARGRGMRLWEEGLRGQIFLGDEAFAERMRSCVSAAVRLGARLREVPRAQRRGPARSLQSYLDDRRGREAGIVAAVREGGYSQAAIAAALGLSPARVSRLIARVETDPAPARGKT